MSTIYLDYMECVGVCSCCQSALSNFDFQEGCCPDCLEPLETLEEEEAV